VANEEHVKRLKQGVVEWNAWRQKQLDADLSGLKLPRTEPTGLFMRLFHAFSADHVRLQVQAAMTEPDLSGVMLSGAKLNGAKLNGARLMLADLSRADLSGADLDTARLVRAKLFGANLSRADLSRADLSRAAVHDANLSNARLYDASLTETDLRGADLRNTLLEGANLTGANLSRANLTGATLGETIIVNVDLTSVIGLERCLHTGPSFVDHLTFQRSKSLSPAFLRGVGLPDDLIEHLPSLLNQAIKYYSCFISYSTKNQDFADRIYEDLQHKGVRCWFAPHDLSIGRKILDGIDEAIRQRDRVVLILSEHAINSDWVETEVTTAFEEERTRKQTVLFPVRLDDAVMTAKEPWAAQLRARNIGDFRHWKDHDGYKRSFERVLRDLKRAAESEK
jgi:uncharacterized protein YjbI with pentapeptide repeats